MHHTRRNFKGLKFRKCGHRFYTLREVISQGCYQSVSGRAFLIITIQKVFMGPQKFWRTVVIRFLEGNPSEKYSASNMDTV